MKKIFLVFLVFTFALVKAQPTCTTISASGNWTVPAGVTTMTVYVFGGGGGSGGCNNSGSDQAGGGGGGGACAINTLAVSAGQVYTLTIGAGGTAGASGGGNGGAGGTSTITGTGGTVSANGGGGGGGSSNGVAGTAGAGATTGAGFSTIYNGGNGTVGVRNASLEVGGAGGGGAGSGGPGGNGTPGTTGGANSVGGAGGTGSYPGGAGAGATNTGGTLAGVAGNVPGGGAAGAASFGSNAAGAAGGAGQVVICYCINCAGTPTGGTAAATVTSGCSSYASTLSLSGNTTGCGITYQWQSSPDNATWSNIAGGTSSTYAATVSSPTYYQCVITCSNGGASANSTSVYCAEGAPSNNNCSGAINLGSITTTTTVTGTNLCATADLWTPSCASGGTAYNNVWYSFTVPAGGGNYSFAITKGTLTYPEIGIIKFSTNCTLAGATEIACFDPTTNANITLNVNCMSAGTYYIAIDDDVFGVPGTFTLTVTQNGTNVNDNCANATNLTLTSTNNNAANTTSFSVTATGNNACATADQGNTSCFTNNQNLWYKFVPIVNGSFYVGVQAGTMSYPEVTVLSGSCGAFTNIGCSGSSATSCQPYGYWSSTYSYAGGCNLTAGTTYYVMVDSWSTAGTFTLTIASLSNDDIPAAAMIADCGVAFTSSTIGATNCGNCQVGAGCNAYTNLDCNAGTTASGNSGGADTYSGMTVENDSWYQFCSTAAQTYSVTFAPNTASCIGPGPAQLQMNLFTGTASALTWVNGNATGTSLTFTVALAAYGCAYVEVDGLSGENCDYSLNVTTSPGCPLPIDLLSFAGENTEDKKIKLDWILASEKDIKYYLVERSPDGISYTQIAKVFSIGNTSQKTTYYAMDERPLNGYNYYRLSSVDINGEQHVGGQTMVTNKSHLPSFGVYPNPATGKISVDLVNFSSPTVMVEIYDTYGKQVFSSSTSLDNGNRVQEIDISAFPAGIYFVKASDGENIFKQSVIVNSYR